MQTPPAPAASLENDDDEIHLAEYFDILVDNKWLVAGITALAAAAQPAACRASTRAISRGGPEPSRRPIAAVGQLRAGRPPSASRARRSRSAADPKLG